jgi:hypothetical protein
MRHPDEGTIHAWLDGALPADEAAELEAHVAACPACAAAVADARGLVAGASRILSALDDAPRGVLPAAGARRPTPADHTAARPRGAGIVPRRRGWLHSPALRIAAAVALVAAGVATIGQLPRLTDGRVARAPRELARDAAATAREAAPAAAPALPDVAQGVRDSAAPGAAGVPRGGAAKATALAATGAAGASEAGPPPASQATTEGGAERHRDVASVTESPPAAPAPGREGALAGAAAADRSIAERREDARREDALREDALREDAQGRGVAAFSARAAA